MKVSQRVNEEAVLLSFAEAEFSSPRHRAAVAQWVTNVDPNRLLNSEPRDWSEQDRRSATRAVRRYRGPILGELLALEPAWFEAVITAAELPALRPIDFPPFDALAPDRKLGSLVAAMDDGKEIPNDRFSEGYRALKSGFDLTKVRGRPSVIAKDRAGLYVVFEGLTRLAVLTSFRARGEPVPDAFGIYLGVSSRASEWRFFGTP